MKSYCKNLVITGEMVAEAYRKWCLSQAGKKNQWRVESEYGAAGKLIGEIAAEISSRSISLRPIHRYRHLERTNGKIRIIGIESVKQQILDYVAVGAMEKLLDARIGFYQVASVRGKGSVFASRTIRKWVQAGKYWTHLDIKQCYPSISHMVVMRILRRYIRSDDVLYVAQTLLATYGDGLDIGSFFSLKMAQLVLSQIYHHIEGLSKVRRGKRKSLVTHQLWYMDDALLMSNDKRDLRMAVRSVIHYAKHELGLTVKPWKICPVSETEPVDIAGYVVRRNRTTIRSSTFLSARRAQRRFQRQPTLRRARTVTSYWGWFTNSCSQRYVESNHLQEIQRAAREIVSAADRRRKCTHDHPRHSRK